MFSLLQRCCAYCRCSGQASSNEGRQDLESIRANDDIKGKSNASYCELKADIISNKQDDKSKSIYSSLRLGTEPAVALPQAPEKEEVVKPKEPATWEEQQRQLAMKFEESGAALCAPPYLKKPRKVVAVAGCFCRCCCS
eukprot:1468074-Amphidinium_carterae.1